MDHPPRPHRRRLLRLGPIGFALLIPLAALIWVALTGYDLHYQLLRLIDARYGWDGLVFYITRLLPGHYFSLYLPLYGLISFCILLIPLHFAPRRSRRRPPIWCYAALLAWALIAPTLPWVLLPYRPSALSVTTWRFLLEASTMLGAAALLALATRSWLVGAALCTAAAAAVGLVALEDRLMQATLRAAIAGADQRVGFPFATVAFYAWHAALAVTLSLWAVAAHRRVTPDHHCPTCGYDLRNLPTPTCPECGQAPPPSPPLPSQASAPP